MAHAHTERLIDAWRLSRGDRRLPTRTDISPAVLGPLLPQVFILGQDEATGEWRLRLAGGFVNDLFGRDLRAAAFLTLWSPGDRAAVSAALEQARLGAEPVVLKSLALALDGRSLGLELTLAPATGPTDEPDRIVGLVQPTGMVARLAGGAVAELHLAGASVGQPRPGLRLVVDNTAAR